MTPRSDFMASFVPSALHPVDTLALIERDWWAALCRFDTTFNGGSEREREQARAVRDFRRLGTEQESA